MTSNFSNGYALLVGVGRYQQTSLSVPITAQDAEDLKDILIDPNYCAYPVNQVEVLSNELAISTNIIQTIDQLADNINGKQATVILFFSGHGWDEEGTYYFLPHNTGFTYDSEHNKHVNPDTAISNDDLVHRIRAISERANKTLVIFNTCFSGGLGTPLGPEGDEDFQQHLVAVPLAPFDEQRDSLAQGAGTVIFTSSQQDEKSWILASAHNSLFVDRLLSALKGEDVPGTEPTISLLPLIDTVKRTVRETARQHNINQDPDYKVYGGMRGEFPIALRLGGQSLSPRSVVAPNPTKSRDYNFGGIRKLLTDAFTPAELDRFLRESATPRFKEIRNSFGYGMGLNEMVDQVIDYCDRYVLMETLLAEVKVHNRAQYDLHVNNLYR